jgi:hypothetical protein
MISRNTIFQALSAYSNYMRQKRQPTELRSKKGQISGRWLLAAAYWRPGCMLLDAEPLNPER